MEFGCRSEPDEVQLVLDRLVWFGTGWTGLGPVGLVSDQLDWFRTGLDWFRTGPLSAPYLTLQLCGFLRMLSVQSFSQLVVQAAACLLPAGLLVFNLDKPSSVKRSDRKSDSDPV